MSSASLDIAWTNRTVGTASGLEPVLSPSIARGQPNIFMQHPLRFDSPLAALGMRGCVQTKEGRSHLHLEPT